MTWRQYGYGVIAACLYVGGALWLDRLSPVWTAQDVAEIAAAAYERNANITEFGWQSPPPTVGVVAVRSVLVDALNTTRDLVDGYDMNLWLVPENDVPGSGSEILTFESKFYTNTVDEYYGYQLSFYSLNNYGYDGGGGADCRSLLTLCTRVAPTPPMECNVVTYPPSRGLVYLINLTAANNFIYATGSTDWSDTGVPTIYGQDQSYFDGKGNWWTHTLGVTNLYVFEPWEGGVYSNDYRVELKSYVVNTGILSAAASVLTSMRRTLSFDVHFNYDSRSDISAYGTSTNSLNDAKAEALNNIEIVNVTNTESLVWARPRWPLDHGGYVLRAYCEMGTEDRIISDDLGYVTKDHSSYMNASTRSFKGVRFKFPTTHSLTNEEVKRVRIYSILLPAHAWPIGWYPSGLDTNWTWTVEWNTMHNPNLNVGFTLGFPGVMSTFDEWVGAGMERSDSNLGILDPIEFVPNHVRWNLVKDVENPRNDDDVKFDWEPDIGGLFTPNANQTYITTLTGPEPEFEYNVREQTEITTSGFFQSVRVLFAVVIDWNWKHLNAVGGGYVPPEP